VDEKVVSEENARAIRRCVGLVFQDPDDQLFLPTLLEDVAFGPLNEGRTSEVAEADARQVLNDLGLEGHEARAAHHLSGGEKRLAALATVLVSRPRLLVLDEPTSNLDARGKRRLVDLLRAREETLLVATHDLEVARALCTRAVVMDSGRLVYDGLLEGVLGDVTWLQNHGLIAPLE
jgi:energy-coupling factor transporter ATP-binding protein EcfA2